MKFFVTLAIVCLLLIDFTQADIRATTILFRHGQRTPSSRNPLMPCELAEDIGYGQLTKFGSWQLYANGLFLHARYQHLFPEDGYFRLSNMQIMSSVPERTIMSLQSFMTGFFPPPLSDMNLPVFWQPFTFTQDYKGKFLYFDYRSNLCPKYDAIFADATRNLPASITTLLQEEKEALDEISVLLGAPLDTFGAVNSLGEAIHIKMMLGESLPLWAANAYETTLYKFNNIMVLMFGSDYKTQVRGGMVITQVVQNMEAVINNAAEGKKFMIYSGHDMNVQALALILGVESQIPQPIPNLADTILIDLVDNGGGEMQVQSLYVDNSGSIPKRFVLDVPGCGKICNFSTFKGVVAKYFVSDFDALCAL